MKKRGERGSKYNAFMGRLHLKHELCSMNVPLKRIMKMNPRTTHFLEIPPPKLDDEQ